MTLSLINYEVNIATYRNQPPDYGLELTQFALSKLKSIYWDPIAQESEPEYWPNVESMLDKLKEFLDQLTCTNLCIGFIQSSLTDSRKSHKDVGIRFMRTRILLQGPQFAGEIVAKVLWNLPNVTSKRVSTSK